LASTTVERRAGLMGDSKAVQTVAYWVVPSVVWMGGMTAGRTAVWWVGYWAVRMAWRKVEQTVGVMAAMKAAWKVEQTVGVMAAMQAAWKVE
jgi:hypothetical protein